MMQNNEIKPIQCVCKKCKHKFTYRHRFPLEGVVVVMPLQHLLLEEVVIECPKCHSKQIKIGKFLRNLKDCIKTGFQFFF